MKRLVLIALIVLIAKVAYELVRQQRSPGSLPDGAPYEPAPVPQSTVGSQQQAPAKVAPTRLAAEPAEGPAAKEPAAESATMSPPSSAGEATPSAPDDLTQVRGIGPVYASKLRNLGIATFSALESFDTEALAEDLDVPPAMVANWQNQARGLRS